MQTKQTNLVKLGREPIDLVFNKVWEVTCMTWPEPVPEKMDRSRTVLTCLHPEHAEQGLS